MEMKNLSWQAFRKTGDIDAYLLYKDVENADKRDEEWRASKQEQSSQDAVNMANQTVC